MAHRPSAASVSLLASPELPRQNGSPLSPSAKRQLVNTTRRPSARSISSSQNVDSLTNFSSMDPDDLFARHTISEVKVAQQRLRADADAKQEELRLMVGERYRDLLQASTSILNLAKSSKHVLEALEEMRDTVNAIQSSRAPKRATTGEDKHLQALQSLSAHVKLLLDAPEHLWRLMERKSYLNAAWLFLLARVVHRALSQEDDDQSWQPYGIDVMEQMPLVQRQWDTITPFRSQISHRATLALREVDSSPGEVCATLLTLHLLESRPLPETLSIYLAQRTKTLSGMLTRTASTSANGDAKPNGRIPHRPRKVAVRETKQKVENALNAISQTVSTARSIFADSPSSSPSLMKLALQYFQAPSDSPGPLPVELQLTTQTLLTTLPSSSHLLLLPQSIKTYKPYIDGSAVTTPTLQPHLRDKLENWFKKAIQDARNAIADWFAGLTSVREIWEVRTSLLAWLKRTEGIDSQERRDLESVIDAACQQQAIVVWKGALDVLESSFQEAIGSATKALEGATAEHVYDTQPIEHLFRAPPLPSMLQSGAQSSAAAAQFSKYRASLRQQLAGRTPLLDAAMSVLERHAGEIQKDLSAMLKNDHSGSPLVTQLSESYRADAETLCDKVYHVLSNTGACEETSARGPVLIARICQELVSNSDFFARIGCSATSSEVLRERLNSLNLTLMESWQEKTVSCIMRDEIAHHVDTHGQKAASDDTAMPTRPSIPLTQGLLSLSSEMQPLGVCLEDERRRLQAGSILQRFTVAYLQISQRTSSKSHVSDLQLTWDLTFLQALNHAWGEDPFGRSDHAQAKLAQQLEQLAGAMDGRRSELNSAAQEYLSRTQILLAELLPSRPVQPTKATPPSKAEKQSTLLPFGTPSVEQRFEPALDLVKPPPRFGLLLVGSATVR